MVKTRTVEMQTQLVGYEFKKKGLPTDKNIAVENSKVSNDYFWKTNEYTDKDVFGRTLDLTALINKPDGYLKGSLSDTQDVDYYKFNITEYRALSFAKDTYNKDITITLDHIPEGCNYEMVLYDEEGNQVGIGKDNGNGGLSITIPNWNTDNRGYTVKVQAKNGSGKPRCRISSFFSDNASGKVMELIRKWQRFRSMQGQSGSRCRKA